MRGSIYRGPTASGRIHLLPSLLSPKPPRAMAGYGDGAANNGFGRRSLHQWEGRLLYMAANNGFGRRSQCKYVYMIYLLLDFIVLRVMIPYYLHSPYRFMRQSLSLRKK
jgi:hypothetical protein